MIRTILIDDEPSAVNVLALLLKKYWKNEIEIVAKSNSPEEGISLIKKHKPDLVFLDIEMPNISGLDLLKSFSNPEFRVVFVTAHDTYAVEAFKLSAIDYLLKPVDSDDIMRTVMKIKNDISQNPNPLSQQISQLEKILYAHQSSGAKIGISMADKVIFIQISDIIYCEASGSYTKVYLLDGTKLLSSKSIGSFDNILSYHKFFRIHHSFLINLDKIKEFHRHSGGVVIMVNKVQLEVSQRKHKDFLEVIDNYII